MVIVRDEPKRTRNLVDHGLDFADAERRFVFEDAEIRARYAGREGRPRFVAIGPLDGRLVTLVFSLPTKQLVSLRIDRDVLERFKAGGPGWQSRMNAALRRAARDLPAV